MIVLVAFVMKAKFLKTNNKNHSYSNISNIQLDNVQLDIQKIQVLNAQNTLFEVFLLIKKVDKNTKNHLNK